jgi:hypothetical protein
MDDDRHFGYKQKFLSKTLILGLFFVYTIRYLLGLFCIYDGRTNTQLVTQGADGAANHDYVRGRRRAMICVRTQEERERERETQRTHLDSVVTQLTAPTIYLDISRQGPDDR